MQRILVMHLLILGSLFCPNLSVNAEASDVNSRADSSGLPTIYIDCSSCDQDYLRTEISMADFVRDRQLADIHLLVTREHTGSGGLQYVMEFIGQDHFDGMRDTLTRSFTNLETDDRIRKGLAETIRLGLVRYLSRTSHAENLSISFSRNAEPTEVSDRWNYWVFSIDLNTWLNGQKATRSLSMNGNISASRITERLKLKMGLWGNYNENKFDFEDVRTLSISRSRGGEITALFAIDGHWSWGLSSEIWSSTFSNRKSDWSGLFGLEYNLFPYSEFARRQLRFQTIIITRYVDYEEETIYDKQNEWLASHKNSVNLELVQPWGSVNGSFSAEYFLHDISRYRIDLWGRTSWRVAAGLSVDFDGNVSRVRNQLSLPKGSASEEEVLLQRRELATNYRYGVSFGFRYTFGSRYNNIVNPRFGN